MIGVCHASGRVTYSPSLTVSTALECASMMPTTIFFVVMDKGREKNNDCNEKKLVV